MINNYGGGIFENLPVAKLMPFEKCFATPQEVDFGQLCGAHGIPHFKPVNWCELENLIHKTMEHGIRVIEVVTDRKVDVVTRHNLLSLGPST